MTKSHIGLLAPRYKTSVYVSGMTRQAYLEVIKDKLYGDRTSQIYN